MFRINPTLESHLHLLTPDPATLRPNRDPPGPSPKPTPHAPVPSPTTRSPQPPAPPHAPTHTCTRPSLCASLAGAAGRTQGLVRSVMRPSAKTPAAWIAPLGRAREAGRGACGAHGPARLPPGRPPTDHPCRSVRRTPSPPHRGSQADALSGAKTHPEFMPRLPLQQLHDGHQSPNETLDKLPTVCHRHSQTKCGCGMISTNDELPITTQRCCRFNVQTLLPLQCTNAAADSMYNTTNVASVKHMRQKTDMLFPFAQTRRALKSTPGQPPPPPPKAGGGRGVVSAPPRHE